jgi:hypothetical protein
LILRTAAIYAKHSGASTAAYPETCCQGNPSSKAGSLLGTPSCPPGCTQTRRDQASCGHQRVYKEQQTGDYVAVAAAHRWAVQRPNCSVHQVWWISNPREQDLLNPVPRYPQPYTSSNPQRRWNFEPALTPQRRGLQILPPSVRSHLFSSSPTITRT